MNTTTYIKSEPSKFSDEFIERSRLHPLEHQVYCSILSGACPYSIIEQLVGNLNSVNEKLTNLVLRSAPPVYVAVSESELEKLKTKLNETND